MKKNDNAGPVLAGLAVIIIVCLVDLTRQGQFYMLWADIVLGFIAVGLFLWDCFRVSVLRCDYSSAGCSPDVLEMILNLIFSLTTSNGKRRSALAFAQFRSHV